MKKRKLISNLIFSGLFAAAIGLAGFGFISFQRDLSTLDKASQENISWSALQLEMEMMRFRESVHEYHAGVGVTVAQVNQRFDILWSRATIFQRGRVGARLREYDAQNHTIERLFKVLTENAHIVENLDSASHEEFEALEQVFIGFAPQLKNLSTTVFVGESQVLSEIHSRMRQSADTTLMLSIVAVIFLLAGLSYSIWQGRRFKKLAHSNNILAVAAEKASQAKTRFLTMMSHEMRTPMNGVLGLLALLRQSKTTVPQENIIIQAERSARQMIGMLTDILEFASLQNDKVELDFKAFELSQLTRSLGDLFGPEAKRAGTNFLVTFGKKCPARLNGDFRRLKQVYTHLAGYFVDLAGINEILIHFGFDRGTLVSTITLNYGRAGQAWTPDLVFGERIDDQDRFAADALGPAVARGLIEKMGGRMFLKESGERQVVIGINIPVEQIVLKKINIHLEMTSEVMATICRTTLNDSRVCYDEMAPENIHVVLHETGSLDEAERVAKLQQKFGNALIIAIGHPINPDIFDLNIEMPSQLVEQMQPILSDLVS